jgi:cytochrome P450
MTFDHDTHRMRRNALNRYFSKAAVGKFEPYIRQSCEKFANRLLDYRNTGPITISSAYSSFTTDVISEYCFGKSFDYLDRDRFVPNMQPASDAFGAMAPILRMAPWISNLMRLVSPYGCPK